MRHCMAVSGALVRSHALNKGKLPAADPETFSARDGSEISLFSTSRHSFRRSESTAPNSSSAITPCLCQSLMLSYLLIRENMWDIDSVGCAMASGAPFPSSSAIVAAPCQTTTVMAQNPQQKQVESTV
mmetsp:Transcript_26197/g.77503  ORF Transcript_26197/g.77503 Transcript_26197/m.77503 type:complete len:128 (+) Transcript_26197:1392-1775(+)